MPQGVMRLASPLCAVDDAALVVRQVGELMTNNGLVNRTAEGLTAMLDELDGLEQTRFWQIHQLYDMSDVSTARQSANARAAIIAARLMAQAMLTRGKSLGSHHRADCA